MICSVDGCEKSAISKGLCSGHNHRLERYGNATFVPPARVRQICSVLDCGKLMNGHGYCLNHYRRFMKYGSPTGGGIVRGSQGDIKKYLKWLFETDTDECIPWPFCKTDDGYGRVNAGYGSVGAHVHVCTVTHGPRPDKADACHSCGNGHLACVNHKHIRWGSRLDNVHDSIKHGTAMFFGRPMDSNDPRIERAA